MLSKFITPSNVLIAMIMAIILMIVLPNVERVFEALGFETRTSLKVKQKELQIAVDTAVEANSKLENFIIIKEEIDKISTVYEEEKVKEEIKVEEKVKKLVKAKETRIVKIKQKKLPEPEENEAIARQNIDMLWNLYESLNKGEIT